MSQRHDLLAYPPLAPDRARVFRGIVLICQLLTLLATWQLWGARVSPPNLPALEGLPTFSLQWIFLGSLALAWFRPVWGIPAHLLVLAAGMLLDQLRIQPTVISLALLLLATLPWAGARLIGSWHLIGLWFYAGLHKLLSPAYWETGPWGFDAAGPLLVAAGIGLAVFEMGLAVFLFLRATRFGMAWVAAVFHALLLLYLAYRLQNAAVWGWNTALVFAPIFLFTDRMPEGEGSPRLLRFALTIALISMLLPLGCYTGKVDNYLCHCLYANNVAAGYLRDPGAPEDEPPSNIAVETFAALRVPCPPEPRIFRAYHERAGGVGEELTIEPPLRWW